MGDTQRAGSSAPAARAALPGLVGLDHVGLTVPDIEQATRFLVDVLGCELLYELAPITGRGEWMREHLGVDPAAEVTHLRFFRCGSSPTLEVFQYAAPHQRLDPPRNSDVGGHHVALYVEDLDAAVAHLRDAGVEVLGEPTTSSGPHLGQRWVYFLAPWGAQLELVSYPAGRAWYREHHVEEPSLVASSNHAAPDNSSSSTKRRTAP
ncbi:VOC family protein [Angustibacter aerolatus]